MTTALGALGSIPFLPLQACGGQQCCPYPSGSWLQLGFPCALLQASKRSWGRNAFLLIHPLLGCQGRGRGQVFAPQALGTQDWTWGGYRETASFSQTHLDSALQPSE